MRKAKKVIGILYKLLLGLPLVVGVICYMKAGENLSDALYYSIHLYGFSFEKTESFSLWLEIVRWLAPVMTAASIMVVVKSLFAFWEVHVLALGKDSNVVYGDSSYAKLLCEKDKNVLRCEHAPVRYAANHLIMFSSDMENLTFCQKYAQRMRGKNIYVCMEELDTTLVKAVDGEAQIKFFNPNDVIAREFWRQRRLWAEAPGRCKIAILGFGSLGKRMLEKALQLNLFSVEQQLEYYIFGDNVQYRSSHSEMSPMNGDKLQYFEADGEEQWELLKCMDMIILTETADIAYIQKVLCSSAPDCQIYYYSPEKDRLCEFLATDRLFPYGESEAVFTLENIKTDRLYENAVKLNAHYADIYGGSAWQQLSGFFKESNISAADFGEVVRELYQRGVSEDELARLEHIRWCRFYFLRYWRYGVPANGSNKDEKKRLHKCLLPFDELSREEQQKDYEVVEMWKQEG